LHRVVNADAIADTPDEEAHVDIVVLLVRIDEAASGLKLILLGG
jgi:hypothetical protein